MIFVLIMFDTWQIDMYRAFQGILLLPQFKTNKEHYFFKCLMWTVQLFLLDFVSPTCLCIYRRPLTVWGNKPFWYCQSVILRCSQQSGVKTLLRSGSKTSCCLWRFRKLGGWLLDIGWNLTWMYQGHHKLAAGFRNFL